MLSVVYKISLIPLTNDFGCERCEPFSVHQIVVTQRLSWGLCVTERRWKLTKCRQGTSNATTLFAPGEVFVRHRCLVFFCRARSGGPGTGEVCPAIRDSSR